MIPPNLEKRRVARAVRAAAVALALCIALGGGPALAGTTPPGDLDGQSFDVCGKWVLKMRNFGKQKFTDYGWVPAFYRGGPTNPGWDPSLLEIRMTFVFGLLGPGTWFTTIPYPDLTGNARQFVVGGTYTTRGRNVNLDVASVSDVLDPNDPASPDTNDGGVDQLEALFEEFAVNELVRSRELVTNVTFAVADRPDRVRIKGRVNGRGDQLKVKLKMKLAYDVQFEIGSRQADQFGVPGRLNLRAETKTCGP